MERIRSLLVNRAAMLCNVTTDAASWRRFEPELASFLNTLPSHPMAQSSWRIGEGPRFEALAIPATVNYVGKGANLYRLGFRPSGAAHVVVKYLRTTWLWDKVRVQGGAYGGSVRSIIARANLPSCHTATPICSKRSTSTTRHPLS